MSCPNPFFFLYMFFALYIKINNKILFQLYNKFHFSYICYNVFEQIRNIGSPGLVSTLEGHTKGINCVEFFTAADKSFLITGSDDFTAKV